MNEAIERLERFEPLEPVGQAASLTNERVRNPKRYTIPFLESRPFPHVDCTTEQRLGFGALVSAVIASRTNGEVLNKSLTGIRFQTCGT